jgi:hypothetical protein
MDVESGADVEAEDEVGDFGKGDEDKDAKGEVGSSIRPGSVQMKVRQSVAS